MCTDFLLVDKPVDPTQVVAARSMEFGQNLNSKVLVQAPDSNVNQIIPADIAHALKITNITQIHVAHGFFGITAFGYTDFITEGFNEKGLSAGALWLPGVTKYPRFKAHSNSINVIFLLDYILGNFTTTAEVVKKLNSSDPGVHFWGFEEQETKTPIHFSLHDASGGSAVIEFLEGGMSVTENPAAVLTNSPPLSWHINNLGNYAHLSYINPPPVKVGNLTIPPQPQGQGAGMSGVPGDSWPASRFVRTFFNVKYALEQRPPSDTAGYVNLAFHILNIVDIAAGVSLTPGSSDEYDITQWIVVKDLKSKTLYIRTYDGLGVYVVNLLESIKNLGGKKERRFAAIPTLGAVALPGL